MKQSGQKKINIFLSLDPEIFKGYFNPQDPSPLYKRQLSHEFELYLMNTIRPAKRDTEFHYKISCRSEADKEYAEPLTYAIRRHFSEARGVINGTFERFKRRTYLLLFFSLSIVLVCQGFIPMLLKGENALSSGLHNSMDVLCWVILWKPIERLIFYWNPFLKDMSVLERLEKADVTITDVVDNFYIAPIQNEQLKRI
jgi:hypothetical protein